MRKFISMGLMISTLLVASTAAAVETAANTSQPQHFLSKRPYATPVVVASAADQAWVGATLVVSPASPASQVMKMHLLSKRAY